MTPFARTSLATRFVLIVALGAVLPLALAGLWLTRSAERSGRALLRSQLEHAATAIKNELDRRWALRDGELQLLSGNTVARKIAIGEPLLGADSSYLLQLARSLNASIPSVAYLARDREQWSYSGLPDANRLDGARSASTSGSPARTISIQLPVTVAGHPSATVIALVSIASLMPSEIARTVAPGATLRIIDRRGDDIWSRVEPFDAEVSPSDRTDWESVERTAAAAELRVIVSAPTAEYVQPFEHAARIGVGLLMAVALVALAMSVVLTRRATESLRRLADAATAVAAGDLARTVNATGNDEIGTLGRAFNAMTESLRQTLGDLASQRALAAVGEFAATLSHEVRNSLTAVRVDLQHARRNLAAGNPETRLVGRALDSVRQLDAVVTGALRVARGGQVVRARVSLDSVLERAMRSAAPAFAERGAELEGPRGERLVNVDADAVALEQLFLNLLINAAQASPPGSTARVEVETSGACVVVRVSDAGPGIDESVRSAVGAPFVSTKRDGTGLGLPIARRIVAAHGGELTLETNANAGTTAIVRLPLAPCEQHPSVVQSERPIRHQDR